MFCNEKSCLKKYFTLHCSERRDKMKICHSCGSLYDNEQMKCEHEGCGQEARLRFFTCDDVEGVLTQYEEIVKREDENRAHEEERAAALLSASSKLTDFLNSDDWQMLEPLLKQTKSRIYLSGEDKGETVWLGTHGIHYSREGIGIEVSAEMSALAVLVFARYHFDDTIHRSYEIFPDFMMAHIYKELRTIMKNAENSTSTK